MPFNHKKYQNEDTRDNPRKSINLKRRHQFARRPNQVAFSERTSIPSKHNGIEDDSFPIILEYKPSYDNNLSRWQKKIIPHIRTNFGDVAKSLEDGEAKNWKAPEKSDYPEEEYFKEAIKIHLYERQDYKKQSTKAWGEIQKYMSTESMIKVSSNKAFKKIRDEDDLLGFWKLILLIHTLESTTGDFIDMRTEYLKKYLLLKQQESESIKDYFDKYLSAIQKLTTIFSNDYMTNNYPNDVQSRLFIKGLHEARYSSLIMECERDTSKYPIDLIGAYHTASIYKTLQNGRLQLADNNKQSNKVAAASIENTKYDNELSDEENNNYTKRDKRILAAIKRQRQNPNHDNKVFITNNTNYKKDDTPKPDFRVCIFCDSREHWMQKCPKWKSYKEKNAKSHQRMKAVVIDPVSGNTDNN